VRGGRGETGGWGSERKVQRRVTPDWVLEAEREMERVIEAEERGLGPAGGGRA